MCIIHSADILKCPRFFMCHSFPFLIFTIPAFPLCSIELILSSSFRYTSFSAMQSALFWSMQKIVILPQCNELRCCRLHSILFALVQILLTGQSSVPYLFFHLLCEAAPSVTKGELLPVEKRFSSTEAQAAERLLRSLYSFSVM